MKCAIAKHNDLLLKQAIQHYRKSSTIFTFLSLYSDFEPYPLDEVVDVLKRKISDLESELEPWRKLGRENEALETQFYTLKKHLKAMEQRQGEMTDEH
ncbi:hypothetical protein [Rodentibacter myodis]|uniref:Uncharacterized protein n=1 Tax=Rodentibacter myodis TaxID=1907939 RepID=A0A1V3JHX0_9PAST|nr:hypothetical protein [Rodentibacter myodis]OOF56027.1 hypothetical protein BKL49_10820 [Rodentibacter myodis]